VRQAEGECHIDVSVHLIITDPTPEVLGQELPALLKAGYTSFKVVHDLRRSGAERSPAARCVRGGAPRAGAPLVMVHAEGYDAIKYMTDPARARGDRTSSVFFHGGPLAPEAG